jgi:hypothetical protein
MISPKDKNYLCQLILKFKDQTITPQELEFLDKTLQQHPENIELLTQIIEVHTQLNRSGDNALIREDNEILSDKLWQTLANEEKTAEIVKCQSPAAEPPHLSVQENLREKEGTKTRKGPLITIMISMAALILLLLFARYLPAPSAIEVATLTDSMKARWDTSSDSKEKGSRLVTGYTPLSLREGIVELVFDNNAKVIIEAPAEFCLLTEDQIKLNHGKLYAVVPQKAIGFSIKTPNSRVIDLGTEFGVRVGEKESTELHVIKGKINLLAGTTNKTAMEVRQGYAKSVSGSTSVVNDIPVKETLFVRQINSKTDLVWRGQKYLDLADALGSGNGFGTGRANIWLDLATGKEGTMLMENPRQHLSEEEIVKLEKRFTDNRYHEVSGKSYIDGVFSPDGRAGAVQVSSQGHIWKDCPDTSGIYFEDIFNGSNINTSYNHRLILNDQVYGTKEFPAIALHSNAAITFNLQAIRQDLPGLEITRFKAICGVSQEAGKGPNKEDFWVLVDGQKRFEAKGLQSGSDSREISIPINSQDHFLTLVSTDGDLAPNYDWGFFGMPRLEIENTQ